MKAQAMFHSFKKPPSVVTFYFVAGFKFTRSDKIWRFFGVHSQHLSLQREYSTRDNKKPPGYILFLDFGEGFILNKPSSEI